MVMAPNMIMVKLAATNLVRNPARSARLPNDSPMITRKAMIHGNPIFWVKAAMVPSNPKPPNHPNAFVRHEET